MKLRPTVNVETRVLSVLVARRSKNPAEAARQTLTRFWWRRRAEMVLFTSRVVRDEVRIGDPKEAKKRLAIAQMLADLPVTREAEELGIELIKRGALPPKATADAFHLAVAAVHCMEFLVSWNCRHLVNTHILNQAFRIFEPAGYNVPRVCTPDAFFGVST
jgi:predicted nucleic acid-binding protein